MMNKPSVNKKKSLIEILYEDDNYIVFNKPAGLLVIPSPKNEQRTLLSVVNEQYASDSNVPNLHPCHRLDRDTSGVIIFAKGKKAQKLMMDEFKQRNVKKFYIAYVNGRLQNDSGEIKRAVKIFDNKKFYKNSGAKVGITRYKIIRKKRYFTIVDVELVTGRTNQIRVHFAQIGHSLVGERKYARGSDCPVKFRRTALHARFLECVNPISEETISVEVDVPEDMKKLT